MIARVHKNRLGRRIRVAALALGAVGLVVGMMATSAYAYGPDGPSGLTPIYGKKSTDLLNNAVPQELEGIGIDEKPGTPLPRDLTFRDQRGQVVSLAKYVDGKTPFILVIAYYQCPMLCTLVLNGLTKGLKDVAWNAGDKFRVLTVSIDPRDTSDSADKKRTTYLAVYGRQGLADNAWDFLSGVAGDNGKNAHALADAIGFHYRWDAASNQFAHAAAAFVFTPDGRLSRTLYGIEYKPEHLRLALTEATDGKLGTAWDKFLLFCYHYDSNARGYVMGARLAMKIGGLVTMLLFVLFLFVILLRRDPASLVVRGIEVAPAQKIPSERTS